MLGDAYALQQLHGDFFGLLLIPLAHVDRAQGDVLHHRQMREQVELLEHHAHLLADSGDVAHVVAELNAIHDDVAFLVLFQTVDAANEGGFARAGGPEYHDHLALVHIHVDAAQHMEVTIPLVYFLAFDDGLAFLGDA